MATPEQSCTKFITSLPLLQCLLIISRPLSDILKFILFIAFNAIVRISLHSKGLKNTSTHLDLIAGEISSGPLVVAPISLKSAGRPLSKTSFI